MNAEIQNVVVVGLDGSASSTAASRWAAAEAQRRGAALALVHAYSVPPVFLGPGVPVPAIGSASEEAAYSIVDEAATALRKAHPGLDITTQVSEASPLDALQAASRHAAMTVVGSHGKHQLTETLLGSVAARLSGHAHSPVVVIRTDPAGRPDGGEGPVVVGLDGSAESDDALAFALQSAAARRTSLIAIRTWNDTGLDDFAGSDPMSSDGGRTDAQEGDLLAAQLSRWADKYPEVPIHREVLRGSPASTLLDYCQRSESSPRPSLLVVGSRGRGGFAGMVLGSTSSALIARATLGVAVVRQINAS